MNTVCVTARQIVQETKFVVEVIPAANTRTVTLRLAVMEYEKGGVV